MDGNSLTPDKVLIEHLKKLMPQVFNEGKIDREKLLASLGEDIDFSNERYVLNWAGKSDCFRVLQAPTTKTLVPVKDESVDFDETGNIFIEGENLEALKVLQKTYFGKVKMIYIDPPYNTGNDSFIYPDKFSENKEEYQKRVGDKDEEGYMTREGMFRKNSRENGQYHSNWLSMIYPRLFLARNLLRDDGVIFVSIDDNEVHNLRMVMNEIFGEENFVTEFPRITKKAGKSSEQIAKNNDYILCFQKSCLSELNSYSHTDEGFKHSDEFVDARGLYKLNQTLDYNSIQYSASLDYEIEINGLILRPGNVSKDEMEKRKRRNPNRDFCWRWSKELFQFGLNNGFIVLKESRDGSRIYTKTYQNATISKNEKGYYVHLIERTRTSTTIDFMENEFSNDNSRKDLDKLFDERIFDYSKPVSLLKRIIFLSTISDDIILDFFAGSCTTAHAVLDLNREDGGNRKFICVQLPEPCDEKSEAFKAGYKTIADIAKERIRRVINKINEEESGKLGFDDKKQDLGFRVFRLTESNFRQWRTDIKTGDELIKQMEIFTDPVREGSADMDIVYELILKSGKDLNSSIEHKNGAYIINSGEMAVLTEKCDKKTIDALIKLKPVKVIALDRIFKENDQLKTNTALQMKDAGIDFKAV